MRNYMTLIVFLISIFGFSQETYFVNAPNGLILRDKPNGKRFAKLPYGSKVVVKNKFQPFSVTDNGKTIEGSWVELDRDNNLQFIFDENAYDIPNKIVAFNGFLTAQNDFINEKEKIVSKYPALKNYYFATDYNSFALKGDFFGDGVEDDLFRMIDENDNIRIIILNHQNSGTKIYGLGGEKDPFDIKSYDFGVLYKVPKGTPLWSNYEDDFRNFSDVPKNEIVKLNYDAFYVHMQEACGGGYVFWKNNKWNWLQQE